MHSNIKTNFMARRVKVTNNVNKIYMYTYTHTYMHKINRKKKKVEGVE